MSRDEWEDEETTQIQRLRAPSEGVGVPTPDEEHPYIVVLSGRSVGRMVRLEPGERVIGRSPRADIRVDDDGVSREHARLRIHDGEVWLEDLGSTNGTWIEDKQVIRATLLKDGQRIRVGTVTILKFGFQDTLERQFLSHLYTSATRDWLTGVHNRRSFADRLDQEIAWHRRHQQPLTLIMVDLDFFKQVNDTHGHPVGDTVLREVAGVLQASCRTEDVVARLGGEEFAVLLRRTPHHEGMILGERLRSAVEGYLFGAPDAQVRITLSAGVLTKEGDAIPAPDEMLRQVDSLLYQAKSGGRNRVVHAQ